MGPFDWCRWLRNDTQKGHYIEGETPRSPFHYSLSEPVSRPSGQGLTDRTRAHGPIFKNLTSQLGREMVEP